MNAADIRDLYRDFFVARGHLAGEPASLVPAGDTSVLFTTAGMQQYKPYFLGVETPPSTRITTCQRSFRTSDVENVGKTARHLTFFEMLGNFSFGDYFKAEAIEWALDLSDQLGIDRSKVWVSVFGGDAQVPADEEAVALWKSHGFTDDRIVRLGRGDNFWGPAGPTGPCGPCSELYYDFGPEMGCDDPDCKPGCDCDRYLEYWNLVFVQYDMDEAGNLTPLPKGSIDTGMGLERIAGITQGVTNVFETDLFVPLVERGAELAGVTPGSSPAVTRALRTMAEHARGASFLIMDGVLPGNDGRDYVLRRIIRRAVQQAVAIGVEKPFLATLTDTVVDQMKGAYPGLVDAQPEIRRVVNEEEVRFRHTLDQGMGILEEALRRARDAGTELPAEVAFELHDTYGFPFDLTREIAAEQDMTVDEERFGHLMEEQRERARAAQKEGAFASGPGEVEDFQRRRPPPCVPTSSATSGSRSSPSCAPSASSATAASPSSSPSRRSTPRAAGRSPTPAGSTPTPASSRSRTWSSSRTTRWSWRAPVEGKVVEGERAKAMVNAVRRHQTACNHTATHLLHNALRIVLGEHVRQGGSMVRPERLRFDFAVREAPTAEQLRQVEDLVNRRIIENHAVRPFVTTREYAAEIGALAFFEEKYGEFVRVLEIDDFSRELCGGTHVSSTSQIGLFKITSSQSVGANTRRIEAITSAAAIDHFRGIEHEWDELAAGLKVRPDRVSATVEKLAEHVRELEKKLKAAESGERRDLAAELLAGAVEAGGIAVVAGSPPVESADELLTLVDEVRARRADSVALLASEVEGRVTAVVAAGDAAVGRGVKAGDVMKAMLPAIGGKGGGKPTLARGGGSDVGGISAALEAGMAAVRDVLGG